MKKELVAFDVDGTLRDNRHTDKWVANERQRRRLIDHAHDKNTKIMVWSGGGEVYAREAARMLGVDHYVDVYADKKVVSCEQAGCNGKQYDDEGQFTSHWHFAYDGPQPDLAYDDIHGFNLGKVNIIVREK